MINNTLNTKEDHIVFNKSSENIRQDGLIWKGADRIGIDQSHVYNLLSRKRIRSSVSCDTPSTQYTGVDMDANDSAFESKYDLTKLFNQMKSLEEVEEDPFTESDLNEF